MKRLFAISLMLIYLTFSVGLVIGTHFCSQFKEISLFKQRKNCCPDAGSEKSCCKNTVSVFQINDNYDSHSTQINFSGNHFIMVILEDFHKRDLFSIQHGHNKLAAIESREHWVLHELKPAIYLTNSVFII